MPVTAKTTPRWPVSQLATFELRDLRTELEAAVKESPSEALEKRLREVVTEQDHRKAAEQASKQKASEMIDHWGEVMTDPEPVETDDDRPGSAEEM